MKAYADNSIYVQQALFLYDTEKELWRYYTARVCDFTDESLRTELFYIIYEPIKENVRSVCPAALREPDKRENYEKALNFICGKITLKLRDKLKHSIPMAEKKYGVTNSNNNKTDNLTVVGDFYVEHKMEENGMAKIEDVTARDTISVLTSDRVGENTEIKKLLSKNGGVTLDLNSGARNEKDPYSKLSEAQITEFFDVMEQFLDSKQAKKLGFVNKMKAKEIIKKNKSKCDIEAIKSVVKLFTDSLAIVGTSLQLFEKASPWITNLFQKQR